MELGRRHDGHSIGNGGTTVRRAGENRSGLGNRDGVNAGKQGRRWPADDRYGTALVFEQCS